MDEAAIREALARRQAWTEPRRQLTEPAKVQDPPATQEERAAAVPSQVPVPALQPAGNGTDMGSRPTRVASANEDLIREALRNRGQPYVWGGASRGGFDCSGFVCYVFARQRGLKLPHSASAQATLGTPVRSEELQPGDLVFFTTYRPGISHVGIYVGDRKFIHAANHRLDVRIDTLEKGYYAHRLRAARRICPIRFSPSDVKALVKESSVVPDGNAQ